MLVETSVCLEPLLQMTEQKFLHFAISAAMSIVCSSIFYPFKGSPICNKSPADFSFSKWVLFLHD